jgi:hypothetical protein
MKESDWKIFKKIKDKALDLFCEKALSEFREVINNDNEPLHDRYLRLYEHVMTRDKRMSILFDGHSRSHAWLQLLAIRSEGLADEVLLKELSAEFLEQTDPKGRDLR